jgi:methionine synthase reductase
VLGLGDTNYDKFCHMGISVNKRIGELGGQRFMELVCADEGTGGLEESIERWKTAMLPALQKHIAANMNDGSVEDEEKMKKKKKKKEEEEEEEAAVEAEKKKREEEAEKENEANAEAEAGAKEGENAWGGMVVPDGVETIAALAARLGLSDMLAHEVAPAMLPRVPSGMKSVSTEDGLDTLTCAPAPSSSSSSSMHSPNGKECKEFSAENPYMATLVGARWLTTPQPEQLGWGDEKRVIHMEVSLGNSGINYVPGDSIGVSVPNRTALVNATIERLNEAEAASGTGSVLSRSTLVRDFSGNGAGSGEPIALGEILDFRLDLVSVPRKACVFALSQQCSDDAERRALQWLCSKDPSGKALWKSFIEDQVVGVGELLVLYPSCKPSLSLLLSCLAPLSPRYYSIASSPRSSPAAVAVAFSVVRYTCGAGDSTTKKICREGLCTSYLESLLRQWLAPTGPSGTVFDMAADKAAPTIRIFHKASLDFHLPGSVSPPLILVGPGTGVAPFLGFLAERSALEAVRGKDSVDDACMGTWRGACDIGEDELPSESKTAVDDYVDSQEPGNITLFFGCRDERDFLYRSDLEAACAIGTLSHLLVAYSRKPDQNKVYVQDRIQEKGAELADLIINQGAYIFICGDGNYMAKDVLKAFQAILMVHSSLDEERANDLLTDLKLRRRYVQDIWS